MKTILKFKRIYPALTIQAIGSTLPKAAMVLQQNLSAHGWVDGALWTALTDLEELMIDPTGDWQIKTPGFTLSAEHTI